MQRYDSLPHEILCWYHVIEYRATRGNRSELVPELKSRRYHVNTPLVYHTIIQRTKDGKPVGIAEQKGHASMREHHLAAGGFPACACFPWSTVPMWKKDYLSSSKSNLNILHFFRNCNLSVVIGFFVLLY